MNRTERENQIAFAGVVVTIESLLENDYINQKDINKVKEIMKANRQRITIPDILESIEDSKIPIVEQNDEAVN